VEEEKGEKSSAIPTKQEEEKDLTLTHNKDSNKDINKDDSKLNIAEKGKHNKTGTNVVN
jgi:hypothetical protein